MRWWLSALVLCAAIPARGAELDLRPCGSEPPQRELLCASLRVPENYALSGERTIDLAVVVVPALEPRPDAAPLFILEGGPGLAVTPIAPFFLAPPGEEYRRERDVILVDHRGTGASAPLRCPALESRSPLEPMYPLELVRECSEALSQKADLRQYGAANAARDLDRVREALGHETIDLWSLSYGTQLAQEYLARFPGRVRRAVLIGTLPRDARVPLDHSANAHRAVELAFHACAIDPLCRTAHPRLRSDWADVLGRFASKPVAMEHAGRSIDVTREAFLEALRSSLATGSALRRLPSIVTAAARGDFAPFLRHLPPDGAAFAEGLYLSNVCTDATSRIGEPEVGPSTNGSWFGSARLRSQIAACREWLGPSAPSPLPSPLSPEAVATPILAIHGEFDHVAAPAPARELCTSLPGCRFLLIPAMGHVPLDFAEWEKGECLDRVILAFYRSADPARIDFDCLDELRPPPFARGEFGRGGSGPGSR